MNNNVLPRFIPRALAAGCLLAVASVSHAGVYAPYVDVTLTDAARRPDRRPAGIQQFTLAFVVAGNGMCRHGAACSRSATARAAAC